MEKRQISHAKEFQEIYVDTPPKRGGTTPQSWDVPTVTSFQRGQYGTGEKKRNLTVEKFDKHDPSQAIKVNVNSHKTRW